MKHVFNTFVFGQNEPQTNNRVIKELINGSKEVLRVFPFNLLILGCILLFAINCYSQPVAINGALSVSGNKIVNKNGLPVSFAGNSLFWCNYNWGGEKYYNANVVSWLRSDWNSGIIRAAMGVEADGGYLSNKAGNKAKVKTVVDAAIANGMYVIIDWHTHVAESNTNEAVAFFKEMAQTYGDKPNVIYEVYNEPINSSWHNDIKPYAETVIDAIRSIDPDNLIIVGTRFYSALVNEPADDPIQRKNIAYTIHFYAAQHKKDYRDRCQYALDKGIALFATEWGTVNADGGGNVDEGETATWIDFLKRNHISHCNWSINDKPEGASALTQGASSSGNWSSNNLTWSGSVVRNILKSYDYGKLTDEVSFSKAPIISSSKLSYTFKVAYTATQSRDLIVSVLDAQGAVLGSSTNTVNGYGVRDVIVNLANLPIIGTTYSYACEIRPVAGNENSRLAQKRIYNVTIVEQEPTTVIEAEAYDAMSGVKTEACDEGGENVGYLDTGDWLSYPNVSIPTAGKYMVYYRVASAQNTGIISLEKDAGKTILGTLDVPNTGDWQTWNTISHIVDFPAGTYNIGLGIKEGGYNLNFLAIAPIQDQTLGIEEAKNDALAFSTYPNPVKDILHINGAGDNSNIEIYNTSGALLMETRGNKVDTKALHQGVYYIKINQTISKFIKM